MLELIVIAVLLHAFQ